MRCCATYSVQQFLFEEAALLDERRFDEWLERCAPDIHYWMPAQTNRNKQDRHLTVGGPHDLPMFEETWEHLASTRSPPRNGSSLGRRTPVADAAPRHQRARIAAEDGIVSCRQQPDVVSHAPRRRRARSSSHRAKTVYARTTTFRWQIAARTIVLDATTVPGPQLEHVLLMGDRFAGRVDLSHRRRLRPRPRARGALHRRGREGQRARALGREKSRTREHVRRCGRRRPTATCAISPRTNARSPRPSRVRQARRVHRQRRDLGRQRNAARSAARSHRRRVRRSLRRERERRAARRQSRGAARSSRVAAQ